MSLTTALRIVAILLILASVFQYLVFEQLLIKIIVVAHIFYILSIFSEKHTQRISVISIGLAIVVPAAAWRMQISGTATMEFFIFNLTVCVYLGLVAFQTLRQRST